PRHRVLARDRGNGLVVELHARLPGVRSEVPGDARLDFRVGGQPAWALPPELMLWHLCAHLVGHADVFTPLRFVWMLDVLGWADAWADAIDFGQAPQVVGTVLALLDEVVPLS